MEQSFESLMKSHLGAGRVFYLENTGAVRPTMTTMRRDVPPVADRETITAKGADEMPTFLYPDPIPLHVIDGVPQYYGPLKSLGKGRYSDDKTRLYVRACRTDGTSVWLSKRVSDEAWFLEGLFV